MQLRWEWQAGNALSAKRLDELHCLRNRIFIVMTEDPWQEADGNDTKDNCYHLLGFSSEADSITAYGRLIVPTEADGVLRFSRIFVLPDFRGKGYFRQIIERIFDKAIALGYRESAMKIHATLSPETDKIYRDFGFEAAGKVYKIPSGICLQDKALPHIGKARAHYKAHRKAVSHHKQSLFAGAQAVKSNQSDSLKVCQALK